MFDYRVRITFVMIRIALAFALLYAAIRGFVTPDAWIGYFPTWINTIIPEVTALTFVGIIEVILALWFLVGRALFIPGLITAALLLGITAVNIPQMDVVFRDISLALVALALAIRD